MFRFSLSGTLFWLLIFILLMLGPLALPVLAGGLNGGPITRDDMPTWLVIPLILGGLLGVRALSRRRS